MKIISKSILGATAIHSLYFMTTMAIGYVKTVNYEPDWEAAWANIENLPSEVSFGYAPSPFLYAGGFVATVLAYGIVLSMYYKFSFNSSEEAASKTIKPNDR